MLAFFFVNRVKTPLKRKILMKRQYRKFTQLIAALALGVVMTLSSVAHAEDNQGFGDVAGDTAALADSNIFVLNSSGATPRDPIHPLG